jgi:prepilin peptidase CpaA
MTPWATIFCAGMLAAAASDLLSRRIPNWLNVSIFCGGLLAQAAGGGPAALGQGLAGAGVGLAMLLPLFYFRWIGGGDVKLVAAAGAWLGPTLSFYATLFGLAGGGALAVLLLVRGGAPLRADVATNLKNAALSMSLPDAPRRQRGQLIPMAVALGAAAIGVYLSRGGA